MTTAIENLKTQAKRLRVTLSETGRPISHSQALEAIARQRGYRDWNTLHAAIGAQRPAPPVALGAHVTGTYLGHAISAEVIGVQSLAGGRYRVKLELDQPVNVSAFPAMEVLRRRLNANIDADGTTVEKTSDGRPHLQLHL